MHHPPSSTPDPRPREGGPVPPAAPVAPERAPWTTLAPPVVVPALLLLGVLLVFCGAYPDSADALFSGAQAWVVGHFDWFYTASVTTFLLFLVLVAASVQWLCLRAWQQ